MEEARAGLGKNRLNRLKTESTHDFHSNCILAALTSSAKDALFHSDMQHLVFYAFRSLGATKRAPRVVHC